MRRESRFPQLVLPFAAVGAAGGHLSGRLLANRALGLLMPVAPELIAVVAAVCAGGLGVLLQRWCAPPGWSHVEEAPTAWHRPPTDRWIRHVPAMILCGVVIGVIVCSVGHEPPEPGMGVIGGFCCAVVLSPVGVAVILAGRRARRAREGSIVAAADRRAVWAILAGALGVVTLAALPDWPAFALGDSAAPWSAMAILVAATATTLAVLGADVRALMRVRALSPDLQPLEPRHDTRDELAGNIVDLGLERSLLGRTTTSDQAYRGVDALEALVRGNPLAAARALRRAVARSVATLVALAAIASAHAAVRGSPAMEGWYLVETCPHRWVRPEGVSCAKPPARSCGVSILFEVTTPSFANTPCRLGDR